MRRLNLPAILLTAALALCTTSLTVTMTPSVASAQDSGEQALLKALGGAMAIEAYTAAGYIGALADGFQAKTYTAQYVKVRLGGLGGGLGASIDQVDGLLSSGSLSPADKQALTGLKGTLVDLKKQTDLLGKYVDTKNAKTAKQFRDLRASTWKSIVAQLGLGKSGPMLEPGGEKLGVK